MGDIGLPAAEAELQRREAEGRLIRITSPAGADRTYTTPELLRMEREIFRVTMSTVILLGGAARIAGYARMGFYEGSSIVLIAIGLPLAVIGSWLDPEARSPDIRTACGRSDF